MHREKRAKFLNLAEAIKGQEISITSIMYYYGSASRSYGEEENMWYLHNANYHQMVSVLTQIVRSMSPLRIEAPEWHPKVADGDIEEED